MHRIIACSLCVNPVTCRHVGSAMCCVGIDYRWHGRVEMLSGTDDKAKGGNDFQQVRKVLHPLANFNFNMPTCPRLSVLIAVMGYKV